MGGRASSNLGFERGRPAAARRTGVARAATAATAVAALVAGVLVAVPAAADEPDAPWLPFNVSLVSVLPDGSAAFDSTDVGVTASDDGRYVAFVGTGGGFTGQLFVRDREAGTTTLISKDDGGDAAAAPIDAAAISGDGNAVAFLTTASLLPSVPVDGNQHVYLADRTTGTLAAVPLPAAPSSTVGAVPGVGVAVSRDGANVALVGMDSDDSERSLVVADMASGVATDIDVQDSYEFPQLSADGSVVAGLDGCCGDHLSVFTSAGVLLKDFGDIEDPLATGGATDVAPYSLSADGNFVAFDTYIADRQTPGIFGVRDNSEIPVPGGRYSGDPRLSANGATIAIVENDDAGSAVFLGNPPDSQAGQLPVTAVDGSRPDGLSTIGQLTENGKAVVFSSSATNIGGPTDGSQQVYYAVSADTAAPTWDMDAALAVDTTSYFTADLSWPDAHDDVAVVAYRLLVDGKQFGVIDGFDTSFTVDGLSPGATHTFSVRPVDFLGHEGPALSATAETTAVARTQVIDSVSVLPDGSPAGASNMNPSVSANGRYVAFVGESDCSANGFDDNATLRSQENPSCYQDNQVFVRDRQAGATTLISHAVGAPDQGDDGGTSDVAISGDGSAIAFVSRADDLVVDDTDDAPQLFVADRATAQVHAVSVPDVGAPITQIADGYGISMDATGTHVAFVGEDDTGNDTYVVVEDWRAGTATLIPVPAGTYEVDEPELSSDGSRLAFVASLPDAETSVVVVNVADPTVPVLSRVIGDQYYYAYDNSRLQPRISLSGDGRFLAYPAPVAPQISYLQVQDLSDLGVAPVTIARPTQPACDTTVDACYDMGAPSLSADGSAIVFDPMTPEGAHTLYKASPVDGAPAPIVALPDGSPDTSYPGNRAPAIIADGTGVVFQSNNDALTLLTTGSDVVYEHDPNTVAPSFTEGAELTADNLTGTQARLNWPAATDDHVVIGYRVTQDGATIADLDPTETTFTVIGLAAGGTYHFAVSGVDAALNVGAPLALDVQHLTARNRPARRRSQSTRLPAAVTRR